MWGGQNKQRGPERDAKQQGIPLKAAVAQQTWICVGESEYFILLFSVWSLEDQHQPGVLLAGTGTGTGTW